MKRLIEILIILFMLPQAALAVAIEEAIVETRVLVDVDGSYVETRYALDTCAASTSCEYALAMPSIKGVIRDVRFEPASTDADLWLANITGETIKGVHTIWAYEECNAGCAASDDLAEPYFNDDSTPRAAVYFNITNNDSSNATGAGAVLILEIEKGAF